LIGLLFFKILLISAIYFIISYFHQKVAIKMLKHERKFRFQVVFSSRCWKQRWSHPLRWSREVIPRDLNMHIWRSEHACLKIKFGLKTDSENKEPNIPEYIEFTALHSLCLHFLCTSYAKHKKCKKKSVMLPKFLPPPGGYVIIWVCMCVWFYLYLT
jgi:hypothetical protein